MALHTVSKAYFWSQKYNFKKILFKSILRWKTVENYFHFKWSFLGFVPMEFLDKDWYFNTVWSWSLMPLCHGFYDPVFSPSTLVNWISWEWKKNKLISPHCLFLEAISKSSTLIRLMRLGKFFKDKWTQIFAPEDLVVSCTIKSFITLTFHHPFWSLGLVQVRISNLTWLL